MANSSLPAESSLQIETNPHSPGSDNASESSVDLDDSPSHVYNDHGSGSPLGNVLNEQGMLSPGSGGVSPVKVVRKKVETSSESVGKCHF